MVNFLKIHAILVLVCLVSVVDGIGQDLSEHNWYFGNSVRGIQFSRTDNSATLVTDQATPFGTGGSGVVSNAANADLLFYTDGLRVYNLAHIQMPGGLLNANTSLNQPVAICPVPNQPTQYYIFTISGTGDLSSTIVDLSLPGNELAPTPALGNVVAASLNTPTGLTNRSEAMIMVPNDNGTDFWLITHENTTDNYTVTTIDAGGLTHTLFLDMTSILGLPGLPISAANFSYHAGSGKIAVSPKTTDRNVIILNFDSGTGGLTFDQYVLNSGVSSTSGQSIYDTEWSNSGRFLYISRHGEAGIPADVVQFDITNPVVSLTTVMSFVPNRSYGLQMAPDSAIYHLYQATAGGPFLVGKFTDVDSVAVNVINTPNAFGAGLNFNGTQFPAFAPGSTSNLSVTFTTAGNCSNSPVSFYPTVTPTADSLVWNFGDGQGSNQWSPIHMYQSQGPFNVEVIAYLNGDTASFDLDLTLTQFDLQLTLVQDTTACECELPVNNGLIINGVLICPDDTNDDFSVTVQAQPGNPLFTWSNGDTGATLRPDSAGYYYVVADDGSGCFAYAGVNIREYDAIDQRANIWHFGFGAGIDFNAPISPIPGPLNTPEGCSVISDRNGQVIFSTDGYRIYDRNNIEITDVNLVPIAFPPGLGGEPGATQSALIIPVAGDETLYYIFTTQEVHGGYGYELRYSLYDIKLNNGDGGLVEYNQLLFTRSTERITGNANWLIAHEYGNNSFRAYPISILGIGNPTISSIGSDHLITDEFNGQGYMELGGQNQLVVALPSFNAPNYTNILEFFDFNTTTGEVTNFQSVNLGLPAQQVYGVEFVGNKVIATLRGASSSYIREVYFDYQGNPVLIPLGGASGPIPGELGAIQTGPDGQIYVAVNGASALGTILLNGDTLQLSTFSPGSFPLGGPTSGLGLPNFIQNIGNGPQQASMSVTGLCFGDSTLFSGTGTDPIDEFLWAFGDGFGDSSQVAQHIYAAPGTYLVTLRVTNRCGLDTLIEQSITINPSPLPPTFLPPGVPQPQPVLCPTITLEAEAAPSPGYSYLWSTGETTRTILVTQQSIVSVTITTAQGCTSTGSVFVVRPRPLDIGPDQTICQNSPTLILDAQSPAVSYEWFIDNVPSGNTQTQSVPTTIPGVYEYKVQVNDTYCSLRDSVLITINESPFFSTTLTPPTCGVANGQIDLSIDRPLSSLFSYFIVGAATGTTRQAVDQETLLTPLVIPITSLLADTYIIQVSDQITGCATIASVPLTDNVITIGPITQTTCDPLILTVNHSATVPYSYQIIDSVTSVVVQSGNPLTNLTFDTSPGVPSGTYIIQVNSGGCSSSITQTFNQNAQVAITGLTTNGCAVPISVGVTGGTAWAWSGPNIVDPTLQTISANPPQGSQTYSVRVTDGVLCPHDTTVTFFVNNNVIVDFAVPNACVDQVTLNAVATPVGSYAYEWFKDGISISPGQSIFAGLPDDGDYRVDVVNTASGCLFSSATKTVTITGDLQLALTPLIPLPCEGVAFTITATTNEPSATFQWYRNDVIISGENNLVLPNRTVGGVYKITALLSGCPAEAVGTVIPRESTPGSLPNGALICPSPANPNPDTREITLNAGAGFQSYQWYIDGALSVGDTDQTLLVTQEGVYSVDLINSVGCPSTDQTNVEEECNPIIVAPTAFRPGSPIPANSTFYVFTYFVASEDFQFFIFNRWGEMVYQSNGLVEEIDQTKRSQQWNGGYNNNLSQPLPAGTYSYIVKFKGFDSQNNVQEKRGGVVLLR